MAFGKQLVLASEFHGRLVKADDEPAAGIRLTRTLNWGWRARTVTDETETDADGRFVFPRVTRRSLIAGVVPHTPSTAQEIVAHGPGGYVNIWFAEKPDYLDQGELGRPIDVVCRLDRKPSASGPVWGTCVALG